MTPHILRFWLIAMMVVLGVRMEGSVSKYTSLPYDAENRLTGLPEVVRVIGTDGRRQAETGSSSDRQRGNTKDEDPTGLLNEGFRYRDLETLTFITRDPAGFVDGPNLYAYVKCNPWTAFDPEGLASEQEEKWGKIARDNNENIFKRFVAIGMTVAEAFNPFRENSSIRDAGRGMSEGFAKASETLDRDAPPGIREFTKLTMGVGSAGSILMTGPAGVGELSESIQQRGLVDTGAAVVDGVINHATNNPYQFAGEMSVAFSGKLPKLSQSASVTAAKTPAPHFSGTDKPWTKGATPGSTYTHIDPKTRKAVQNAVYDDAGDVVGHVDFKNHGHGAPSGHGHTFPQPGNPASGHGKGKPHIPNNQLPPGWDTLPPGVQPHTPLGQ